MMNVLTVFSGPRGGKSIASVVQKSAPRSASQNDETVQDVEGPEKDSSTKKLRDDGLDSTQSQKKGKGKGKGKAVGQLY